MSGRVTMTLDHALDVFYLATLYVESTGSLDTNQIDAYLTMAEKCDFQLSGPLSASAPGVCKESAIEALALHRARVGP